MSVSFASSPLRALLALSTIVVGPLSFSLIVAPVAKGDDRTSARGDDRSFAAQRSGLAKAALGNLVADYEEAELDALLGHGAIVRLTSNAGDLTASLQTIASDDDFRLTRAKNAIDAFEANYQSAVTRYDAELADRCFDGPFVLVVGDVLDEAGDDVWRAARALGFRVKLPHPARIEDVCGEVDGK